MNDFLPVNCYPSQKEASAEKIFNALELGAWVQLLPPNQKGFLTLPGNFPQGPGLLLSSSGSSGSKKHCLHSSENLDKSANATGEWLLEQGFLPETCVLFNPLPMHHVSGLMPWWRSRSWGAEYISLTPDLMRDPALLERSFRCLERDVLKPRLISLVPTLLKRLMAHPLGLKWLKSFSVIWIGGASLSPELEKESRLNGLQLAPCYGSTETASMIASLTPKEFLNGKSGCGKPLQDVQLRLDSEGTLFVRTSRLAKYLLTKDGLRDSCDCDGWWESGDRAKIEFGETSQHLTILGRIDLAIHSGGETVFPEEIESKLLDLVKVHGLPVESILLLPIKDPEWGHRLSALVRFKTEISKPVLKGLLDKLSTLVADWMPAEKPFSWHSCPGLMLNELGKFDRAKWSNWLKVNEQI